MARTSVFSKASDDMVCRVNALGLAMDNPSRLLAVHALKVCARVCFLLPCFVWFGSVLQKD